MSQGSCSTVGRAKSDLAAFINQLQWRCAPQSSSAEEGSFPRNPPFSRQKTRGRNTILRAAASEARRALDWEVKVQTFVQRLSSGAEPKRRRRRDLRRIPQ